MNLNALGYGIAELSISLLVAIGGLLQRGCELPNQPPGSGLRESAYPATIHRLSAAQLDALRKEYAALNDNRICTSLDEFGFPQYDLGPCLGREILRVPITGSVEEAVAKIKLILLKNRKFTNVSDTANVKVRRFHRLNGCIACDGTPGDIQQIQWRLDFDNQVYGGLEVLESGIVAFSDAAGVTMMGGNFYSGVMIPSTEAVSFEEAKTALIGKELQYSDWTGSKVFVIEGNSFPEVETPEKVVLPVRTADTIDLHIAWRVPVGGTDPWWFVYVDIVTGETLREEMLVVF